MQYLYYYTKRGFEHTFNFCHNSNFLIIINLKNKNGHKSLKNKITLKMKKTIFLGNLTIFFEERSLRSDEKKIFQKLPKRWFFPFLG